jgi:hypothetical protein
VTAGRASNVRDLSPPTVGARLQGLAVGPRGGTIVAFVTGAKRNNANPKPPLALNAIARAADSRAWGPIENVTTPTGTDDIIASDALITADPVSGQSVLMWSDPLQSAPNPIPVKYSVRSPG